MTDESAKPAMPKRSMGKHRRRTHLPIGAEPGVMNVDPHALPSTVLVTAYGPDSLVERSACGMAELAQLREAHPVVWVQVHGLGDLEVLRLLGEQFDLHRLALADVVNVHQRAKVEDYGSHEFLIARLADNGGAHDTEQFAMFVGAGFVLSFEERAGSCFDLVRKRLLDAVGLIRQRGSDYLAYALLDAVVDSYFPVLEQSSERLQHIEDELLGEGDSRTVVGDLHESRRELQSLRRALWPLREASGSLLRGESAHFTAEIRPYLRDVHDHVVQLLDLLENQRELVSSLLELHLSMVNQRLNEVMKLLTITATIFIPLTFVVGVYGMNFEWMPELKVWWSYPACLLAMALIAGGMVYSFRRRGWL